MENLKGIDLLRNPFFNKGTAFTKEERGKYELEGLLPVAIRSIDEQAEIVYKRVNSIEDNLEKNLYLMNIYNTNRRLFYYTAGKYVTELLPIIYTPTIGDAVINYSKTFDSPKDAVFLSAFDIDNIEKQINAGIKDLDEIKLIVVTDGEGVLGIGDWGVQGVNISIGKLAVYTIASGINPKNVLPVVIDAGTNNEELLNSDFYIGNKKERMTGDKYYKYIDKFVSVVTKMFPDVLVHWEDFGRGNARTILEKYRKKICTFNDDIQGTGVMMVSALNAVAKITNITVKDHKIVIFGGGTAGVGVSDQILFEKIRAGKSEEEALKDFYLVDRYGLIIDNMENLTEGQRKYARSNNEFLNPITDLAKIVKEVEPTVLIGTSGGAGAFTKEVVEIMSSINERPAIMPISNPTRLCEAKASDIIKWSDGKALVVTGSPSEPVEYNGVTYKIGQANNALLYPGLGLGIVAAKAKMVTDNMLSAAAYGIASLQDLSKEGAAILPPVNLLREASKLVAVSVVNQAIADGVNKYSIENSEKVIEELIWNAEY
ncbi:MAG: NAD-dependent malic enzyme [Sarcina sp.]